MAAPSISFFSPGLPLADFIAAMRECPPPESDCFCDPCAMGTILQALQLGGTVDTIERLRFWQCKNPCPILNLQSKTGKKDLDRMFVRAGAKTLNEIDCFCDDAVWSFLMFVLYEYGVATLIRVATLRCATCAARPVTPTPVTPTPVTPTPTPEPLPVSCDLPDPDVLDNAYVA